jgi:hypothetical protein
MKGSEKVMKKLSYILIFFSLMVAAVVCATPKVDHSNGLDHMTITDTINPYLIGT